jgi:hypothetical protein
VIAISVTLGAKTNVVLAVSAPMVATTCNNSLSNPPKVTDEALVTSHALRESVNDKLASVYGPAFSMTEHSLSKIGLIKFSIDHWVFGVAELQ